MVIRPAVKEDLKTMFRISVAAHQAGYAEFIPSDRRADFDNRYVLNDENEVTFVSRMEDRLNNSSWFVWAAEDDGEVLGYTLSFKQSDSILLKKGLFVRPDAQGKGIGKALFEKSLLDIDTGEIHLTVIDNNNRAINLYTHNGFIVTEPAKKQFYGANQVVMTLYKY